MTPAHRIVLYRLPVPEAPSPKVDWRYLPSSKSRQARYGVSYLRNLCAQAGLGFTENDPDEDTGAVDALVRFAEAAVTVQVKCSRRTKADQTPASISVKPHWVASWAKQLDPVYFIVVQVPPGEGAGWIKHEDLRTIHETRAFWRRIDVSKIGKSLSVDTSRRLTIATFNEWHSDMLVAHGQPATVKNAS